MSDPLSLGEKILSWRKCQSKNIQFAIRNSGIIFIALVFIILGSIFRFWNMKPVFYAQAYGGDMEEISQIGMQLSENRQARIFQEKEVSDDLADVFGLKKSEKKEKLASGQFAQKIYGMVGNTPIKEMVPFISRRDEKVAAFLVGIAKKESGWGEHVPTLNGKDCYNYWGYKGSASRGSAMGYACFASAEEAVKIVGDRLEVLINKNHTTASKMLVWKCGSSCAGHDPKGVESWVATVAMYFEQIVS